MSGIVFVKISGISNRWSYLEPSINIVLFTGSARYTTWARLLIKLVSLSRPNFNCIVLSFVFFVLHYVSCTLHVTICNCRSLHYKHWLLWDSFCNVWVVIVYFFHCCCNKQLTYKCTKCIVILEIWMCQLNLSCSIHFVVVYMVLSYGYLSRWDWVY